MIKKTFIDMRQFYRLNGALSLPATALSIFEPEKSLLFPARNKRNLPQPPFLPAFLKICGSRHKCCAKAV
jgi:hypothetical protein